MSWAYNNIDVYVSLSDNILGETSVATENWVPLSSYGILRGRPALTPSSLEGDQLSIPGRDGSPYDLLSRRRGNAKIEFEILVVDTWVFADMELTIQDRVDIILALINGMKRVSYKMPGKEPYFYYIVYKSSATLTDADEKAATIKVQCDVHPFEYFFTGNIPIEIPASGTVQVNNSFPCSVCMPTYVVAGGGGDLYLDSNYRVSVSSSLNHAAMLDTFTWIVSDLSGQENLNRYFSGEYSDLHIPSHSPAVRITIQSTLPSAALVYLRKGIIR